MRSNFLRRDSLKLFSRKLKKKNTATVDLKFLMQITRPGQTGEKTFDNFGQEVTAILD